MKQSASHQLYTHWNEKRRGRVSPERSDMDPAAIRGCLSDTFMLEIDGAGTYPFRLCGTRLAALFAGDPKGQSFLRYWDAVSAHELSGLLACVHDEATIIVAGAAAGRAAGTPVSYEMLLLPLRCDGKTHARVLGCLTPVAVPAWLGLVEGYPLALSSWRTVSQEALRLSNGQLGGLEAVGGMRLAATAKAPQTGVSRHAHLTVYQGGLFGHQKNR